MRNILALVMACCVLVAGCGQRERTAQDDNGVISISVWHPWGGVQKEKFDAVVEEFNRTHPKLRVRSVFTPNDLSNNQKFFTAVAANKAPDVTFVDGQQTAAWAQQGALQPLDDWLERDGITRDDYFPPCWDQNEYAGRSWALTYCADPNFAFVWNKKVFREVGLDPEKPPRTIAELDRYNDIITKKVDGDIVRMGIIPWGQYGGANSLFTWGWAFGGKFYDTKTGKVTANDAGVVRALEWIASYADKYGATKVGAFSTGFGSREQNPFYIGKVAMQCMHISSLEEMKQYAPNLDYGIGYLPSAPGGGAHSSWVGGWCLALPKGSPNAEAGWEFIKWCCREKQGTAAVGKIQGVFPGFKRSPYFDRIRNKKGYGEFLQILEECRHQRPVMPAQAYYMSALGRAVDYAIYNDVGPHEVLDQATRDTQAELDLMLAGR